MSKTHLGVLVQGAIGTLVADGAIDVDNVSLAILDGTDATVAATLADGDEGQIMNVKAVDVTNAVTLTPANFQDGAKLTFDTANDAATIRFASGNWHIIGNYGSVLS